MVERWDENIWDENIGNVTPEGFGFAYRAPLRKRLGLAWRLIKGESVAYRIGVHGTRLYLPGPGGVVGCEVRPEGFEATGAEVPA